MNTGAVLSSLLMEFSQWHPLPKMSCFICIKNLLETKPILNNILEHILLNLYLSRCLHFPAPRDFYKLCLIKPVIPASTRSEWFFARINVVLAAQTFLYGQGHLMHSSMTVGVLFFSLSFSRVQCKALAFFPLCITTDKTNTFVYPKTLLYLPLNTKQIG